MNRISTTWLMLSIASIIAFSSPPRCWANERALIDWIEQLGGKATTDAEGRVTEVDLRHSWLTDADLKRVGRINGLRAVRLSYTKVTDQGLEYLKPLEQVEELDLYYAESVSDAGIVHLKHWRKLKRLNMRGTKVTSTLFDHLVGMPQLEELDVGYSRVNDDNFERLGEMPQLRSLMIGGNKMSGAALPLLKLVPTLRELELGGQQRTDSGLWSVAMTDANCDVLARLSGLESLNLADTSISDRGLQRLAPLKNLRHLRLSRDKITGKGLAGIADLPHLIELNCSGCEGVDDGALAVFSGMKSLELLQLEGTKVTLDGLLATLKPPSLKRLFVKASAPESFKTLEQKWQGVEIVVAP